MRKHHEPLRRLLFSNPNLSHHDLLLALPPRPRYLPRVSSPKRLALVATVSLARSRLFANYTPIPTLTASATKLPPKILFGKELIAKMADQYQDPDMFGGDDDAALRYAMQLSLQEASNLNAGGPANAPNEAVSAGTSGVDEDEKWRIKFEDDFEDESDSNDSSDDLDQALRRRASAQKSAMKNIKQENNISVKMENKISSTAATAGSSTAPAAASSQQTKSQQQAPAPKNSRPIGALKASDKPSTAAVPGLGPLAGLDRKAMEQERLARVASRKRQASSTPESSKDARPAQRPKIGDGNGCTLFPMTGAFPLSATSFGEPRTLGSSSQASAFHTSSAAAARKTFTSPKASSYQRKPAKLGDGEQHNASLGSIGSVKRGKGKDDGLIDLSLPNLKFPHGVVKKTWVYGCPRTGDDVKIEEVLQKDELELAVLSSFVWDEDWLFSKLRTDGTTKTIMVAFAPDETTKQSMQRNNPYSWVRFCFPPMSGGCMHSKLQLLKFPGYVRVVVPSSNLVPYDWGMSGDMENYVFMIDVPKRRSTRSDENTQAGQQKEDPTHPPFAQDLFYFLRAKGLDEALVATLEKGYDFSETGKYGFVHTISGSHTKKEDWQRIGPPGLGRAVKQLGLATNAPLEIDYVASSIGSLRAPFLMNLYYAAQGDLGLKEYDSRAVSKAKTADGLRLKKEISALLDERFRIYFPTRDTVAKSRGGFNGAGTICFQRKWWEHDEFPRAMMRDCRNDTRHGVLMHSKIMFVRPQQEDLEDEGLPQQLSTLSAFVGGGRKLGVGEGGSAASSGTVVVDLTSDVDGDETASEPEIEAPAESTEGKGKAKTKGKGKEEVVVEAAQSRPRAWAYVGSANISESAWGYISKDRGTKQPKLYCRNWECGVIVPGHSVPDASASKDEKKKLAGMGLFGGVVPVPFEYPAAHIDGTAAKEAGEKVRGSMAGRREPWFLNEA